MTNLFRPLFPDLNRQLDQVFDELLHRPWGVSAAAWLPKLDLFEGPDAYTVELEVPGIEPADLRVTAVGRSLTVAGERRRDRCAGGETARCECSIGRFERTVVFATPVDGAAASARCRNGLLRVRLPKTNEPGDGVHEVRIGD